MATNTTLTAGQIAAHAITLTGSSVDTVTFPVSTNQVEVISDGVADLYVTVDGSVPTVAGLATLRIPAGSVSVRVIATPTSGVTVVKLISSGATTYSVTGPI